MKISVIGIGPGSEADITCGAVAALGEADAVVGYKYYFQFVRRYLRPDADCIDTGMRRERERAAQALELAEAGRKVAVISSGDAGIYGMAPLIMEMVAERGLDIVVEVCPGISAFQKAAALLGAPVGHDFCVISLSDLMTPWALIERRIRAAAQADFVTAVYNPRSHERYWQLSRLREIFILEGRSPETPVGIVRQAGRQDQEVRTTTLKALDPESIDMFTVLIIGNSQTFIASTAGAERMVTPRGYYREASPDGAKLGQAIMTESFRTIYRELFDTSKCSKFGRFDTSKCSTFGRFDTSKNIPLGHLWALLHAIHTTADFEMAQLLYSDPDAVETMYNKVRAQELKTIVTDVTMVVSGIRKGALVRLGIEAKCYLSDPRVAAMAESEGITRTQAGIRLAVAEHPDALFAFGNAPTALLELASLIRSGKARPAGIIAAPVGFVHVCESKHAIKVFRDIPKLIIEGRKGGSNLAATLCNAILTFDDAAQFRPGRDL